MEKQRGRPPPSSASAAATTAAAAAFFVASWLALHLDPLRLSLLSSDPFFDARIVPQPPSSSPQPRDAASRLSNSSKWSLHGLLGPESIAFDAGGGGPYTGVADGRIVRWNGERWVYFAHTSPTFSYDECVGDGRKILPQILKTEHKCGRPLGLRFHSGSGDLYIADAYFGLLRVGREGGAATPLASEAEGQRVTFANDLAVANDGTVYFTDSSAKYQRRNFFLLVVSGDDSGRVIRYDPATGNASVVAKGLQFPNGVELSEDERYLVVAESVTGRLLRLHLEKDGAAAVEVMAVLGGYPDNVRRNKKGQYWVAMHCRRNWVWRLTGQRPWLRRAALRLPIPFRFLYRLFNGWRPHGMVALYTPLGLLVDVLQDSSGRVVRFASEVEELDDGRLLIASVLQPYVSVYSPNATRTAEDLAVL